VHKLVMAAFRPVDKFPPSQIPLEDFEASPESVKKWIRQTVIINHIDHDSHNNRVENLEYTTQYDNTMKAVKHHGRKYSSVRPSHRVLRVEASQNL
jgi:hypothetical protein